MSRFGWAYVNDIVTGSANAGGPINSIQYNSGSNSFSGSSNFLFNSATNTVTLLGTLSGSSLVISASAISASTYYGISGSGATNPGGSNTAIQFNSGSTFSGSVFLTYDYTNRAVQIGGPSSITTGSLSVSGSTKLGAYGTDTHAISGTVYLANSLNVSGATNLTGNVKSLGQISASLDLTTNSNITAAGNITSTGGILSASSAINTNGTIVAASNITSNGIISSSGGINTNGGIYSTNGLITSGSVSSSFGIQTGGGINAINNIVTSGSLSASANAYISGNLYVSGTTNVGPIYSTGIVSASSFQGDAYGLYGIQGINVDGVGDDWTVQFKSGDTGTLTGSSGLIFSGSALTASIGKFDTIIVSRTSTSSSILLTSTQHIIAVNTSAATGSVVLSLPNGMNLPSGKHYVVKDEGGNANNRNIILSCSVAGQTIDGSSSLTITSPYAALNVYCNGIGNYFVY